MEETYFFVLSTLANIWLNNCEAYKADPFQMCSQHG